VGRNFCGRNFHGL